jgi:carboxypeptidase family protein
MSMFRIEQRSGRAQRQSAHQARIQWIHRAGHSICALAALMFLATVATAQSTSQLNGRVLDPSDAAVPGANITLTDMETGLRRTATSNGAGLYQFLDVPPGNYRLEATANGFAPFLEANLALAVNTASSVTIGRCGLPF